MPGTSNICSVRGNTSEQDQLGRRRVRCAMDDHEIMKGGQQYDSTG
jgi:hypothetical protein